MDLYVDVVTCSIWGQNIFNSVTFKPSLVPLYLIVRRQINIKNVLVMGTCEKKNKWVLKIKPTIYFKGMDIGNVVKCQLLIWTFLNTTCITFIFLKYYMIGLITCSTLEPITALVFIWTIYIRVQYICEILKRKISICYYYSSLNLYHNLYFFSTVFMCLNVNPSK